MPFHQPGPPFLQASWTLVCQGQLAYNRFFYQPPGAGDYEQGQADAALAFWIGNVLTPLQAVLATEVEIVVFDLKSRGQNTLLESQTVSGAMGVVAGDSMPFQDVSAIKWPLGVFGGGQKFLNGHTYISGMSEAECSGGHISGAQASAMGDLAVAIEADITIGGDPAPFFIWSNTYASANPPQGHSILSALRTLRHRRAGS